MAPVAAREERTRDLEAIGAGEKDRLVEVQQGIGQERDAAGRIKVESWAPFASWWVKQEALSGTESFVALQLAAKVNTRFRGDFVEDLTPRRDLRIVDPEGRVYDIVSVREVGRRAGLEVLAWARAE